MKWILHLVFCLILPSALSGQVRWHTTEATAHFTSDAPLELIEARSDELKGVLDPTQKRFAFSIPIRSFQGFNSPLQRDHFNENYLESDRFPKATFSGKIIGSLDLSTEGEQSFRAKGNLSIHGVVQERIIKVSGVVKDGTFSIQSVFTILLEEYGITIPRIVYQKIAEEIVIEVNAVFTPIPRQ